MFSHRLQACVPARRLFVSESTAKKYNAHIRNTHKVLSLPKNHKDDNPRETVIIQSPSLHFPSWLTEDPKRVADLQPVSHLLRNDGLRTPKSVQTLTPLRYFLFNSSVEARKNLLFLAKAYAESDLNNKGIKLCVTGKLKGDDYSKALKRIVSHEPGIILTGYVDESSKLDLYLNVWVYSALRWSKASASQFSMEPAWECPLSRATANHTSKSKASMTSANMFCVSTHSTAANGQRH